MSVDNKQFIFTTKKVKEITDKINEGYIIKRYQNPWFKNEVGARRSGLAFKMTEEEYLIYIKCKLDIKYFANNYCNIKLEDGSVGQMTLRDYQTDILDLYTKNRFSILMASRQVGKCLDPITEVITYDNYKEIKIPLFKLLYKSKPKNTLYEHIKYFIYNIIHYIQK